MKFKSILFFLWLVSIQAMGQNFSGQWKGQFTDNSSSFAGWGGNRCDYVIEIECRGKLVTGYSYTYFNEGAKRYYTICKLEGKFDKNANTIEFTEVERTKTNVPSSIHNCFQIHKLTYNAGAEEQSLEGNWYPAPNQQGDCGYGSTTLIRRVLQKNPAVAKTPVIKAKPSVPKLPSRITPPVVVKPKTINPPVTKAKPKPVIPPPIVKLNPITENKLPEPVFTKPEDIVQKPNLDKFFEKRNNTLLKTIEIENATFRVDLYDNGDIDGDSISLFYNGRLLLQHKRLSDKAITLTLRSDDSKDLNELVMYAENLGEIPPNTALMVVTDGDNRYEVRIASDLQKSGVIRFIHKPKSGQ